MKDREIIRKQIRFMMYGRGLDTKQLAEKANLSVSHTRNLISGVYSSAPGRKKIEDSIGYPIWSDQVLEGSAAHGEPGKDAE